jgi:hypothetical protein
MAPDLAHYLPITSDEQNIVSFFLDLHSGQVLLALLAEVYSVENANPELG